MAIPSHFKLSFPCENLARIHALLNRKMKTYETTVREPWFGLIKEGKKTYEGRAFDGERIFYNVGDILRITNGDKESEFIVKKIGRIVRANSFKDLFFIVGIQALLPGINSIKEGVEIYRKWISEERENTAGVVAIEMISI